MTISGRPALRYELHEEEKRRLCRLTIGVSKSNVLHVKNNIPNSDCKVEIAILEAIVRNLDK